jgi:hypothetical protein
MFLQDLLNALPWCCTAALLVTIAWFLVEPYLVTGPADWLRWAVAGGTLACAVLVAFGWAFRRRPSRLTAALALDERFGLKERVTTSLLLATHEQASPAGQALLEDVNQRVSGLDLPSRFGLRLSWNAALVPATALALLLVAFLYHPETGNAGSTLNPERAQAIPNKTEIEQQIKSLARKDKAPKPTPEPGKDDKLRQLDDDLDNLLARPRDTKDQLSDRLKDLSALEDKIEEEQKDLDDKAQAVKDQLQQMDRLSKKPRKEGPGNDLQDAVNQGDLKQAKEEMDRLSKDLKDKKLKDKDKEQLEEQMQDVENKLQTLSRQQEDQKEEEEKLRDMARKGELDPEALDRELDQLKKNSDKMDKQDSKEAQEAAEELKKAEQAMKEGKDDEAAEHLQKAGEKMGQMGGDGEREGLAEQLQQVRSVRRVMGQGLSGQGKGEGRRPEAKDGETASVDKKAPSALDPKKKMQVAGTAEGKGYRKKSSAEVADEIKQASQDAPEAIERDRNIPRGATSDMVKGYFQNLGGQNTDKPKPGDKP